MAGLWLLTLPAFAGGPYTNSLGMVFVDVPGTSVKFCIWDTRVQDYRAYVEANPDAGIDGSWKSPGFKQGDTHPVVNVRWNDAQLFCVWLTKTDRKAGCITSRQRYRLPTDAEWSVAVGLPPETGYTPHDKSMNKENENVYPWGTNWPPPVGAGNYADMTYKLKVQVGIYIEGYDDDYAYTSPVGSFKPNKFGLYDMGGNVRQWCEDMYGVDRQEREDNTTRGGYYGDALDCFIMSKNREPEPPGSSQRHIGFRCVLENPKE